MCFVCVEDVEWEELEWGDLGWVVRPQNVPEAAQLCVLDVKIAPGQGHDFHKHPNQEEVIFLRSGTIEQWVEDEKRILKPGDVVFIAQDTVHASFVPSDASEDARVLVVLGPSHGVEGYEAVEVAAEEPWASLRS